MDTRNRLTDLTGEEGGWCRKRLTKGHAHICIALGHRQQCGEGQGGEGGGWVERGRAGKIEDICDNVNNKKKVLRLSCSRDLQDC